MYVYINTHTLNLSRHEQVCLLRLDCSRDTSPINGSD